MGDFGTMMGQSDWARGYSPSRSLEEDDERVKGAVEAERLAIQALDVKRSQLINLGQQLAQKWGVELLAVENRSKSVSAAKAELVLVFGLRMNGTAQWCVRQKLAPGIKLSGKLSKGWTVVIPEAELPIIERIFK
jgi:hypothetical protein